MTRHNDLDNHPNMRRTLQLGCGFLAASFVLAGCNSDDHRLGGPFRDSGPGSGEGGGGGGEGGSGGGEGGSGGSAGDLGDCAPPSDPSRAALCLTLEPESIQFETPRETRLDGRGILAVQVFDTPTPDGPAAPKTSRRSSSYLIRRGTDGGVPVPFPPDQALVTGLPAFRLDNLPPTAYVRAIFADNIDTLRFNRPTWGTWLGGYDLSAGPIDTPPIQTVEIPAGTGRSIRMPLVAVRRLRATLSLASSVTPLDDGEGPAWALAVRTATPREDEPIHGGAIVPCARVGAGSSPTLEGMLVGSGTFYLAAGVDDYNLGGTIPPGGLLSVNVNGSMFTLPAATRLDVAPNAYTVDATVPLNFLLSLGAGGAPRPFSCATVDAGR